MYHIRQIEPKEASLLRDIRLESLKRYPLSYTATYEEESTHDVNWFEMLISEQVIFGAWHDASGELAGTVCLTPDRRPRNQHKMTLRMVYVRDNHQRNGLARSMIEAAIAYATPLATQLLLSVESGNGGAIKLYESLGFTTYGKEPHATLLPDGSYLDDILMIKFL